MEYINKTTKDGKVVKLKNYKKKVKINKIKRRLFLVLFLLIILIIILLYAPFMQIKKINCYGNSVISSEDIVLNSKICIGNNIFRINKNKAIDYIDDNPYVKTVNIYRKLPSTININIEECQVFAYLKKDNGYVYLNEECKVLELSDVPPDKNVPLIKGVNVTSKVVNEVIEIKNIAQLDCIKDILSVLNNSKFKGMITLIDVTDTKKNKITVNNILEIVLGDTENLDYKLNFMAAGAYDSLGSNQAGTLDVSYGCNAVFKEKQ